MFLEIFRKGLNKSTCSICQTRKYYTFSLPERDRCNYERNTCKFAAVAENSLPVRVVSEEKGTHTEMDCNTSPGSIQSHFLKSQPPARTVSRLA